MQSDVDSYTNGEKSYIEASMRKTDRKLDEKGREGSKDC